MAKFIILFCVLLFSVYLTEQAYFLQHDYINSINKVATTWKAGVNFDPDTSEDMIIGLLGSVRDENESRRRLKTSDRAYGHNYRLPKYFDARKHWKHCETLIGTVRDQGHCGSCWAVATTGAFADRLCIATGGEFDRLLSAEETAFCCKTCGHGCHGGQSYKAWEFFRTHGVVTGGNYNTSDGCQPYKIRSCLHHEAGPGSCDSQPDESDQKCDNYCYGDNTIDFENDHWKTRDSYYLSSTAIQRDLKAYGPIEASFSVYDDFVHYKSGVYQKTENATRLGRHAVKLIGWGVQKDIKYWLLVNSWNYTWGDQGTFKIVRGTNECGIEDSTTAGIPDI